MKKIVQSLFSILFVLLFSIQCSDYKKDKSANIKVDYLFTNGKIYTVNEKQSWAEAVAVKAFQTKTTKVIDLNGKMLLPGFIDTNAHPVMAAAYHGSLILDLEESIENWISETKKYIKENPDKPYYVGYGFLAAIFGSEGPNKKLLDVISTDKPIVLIDEGWHSAWVNSKAFEIADIDKNTLDPIPGIHFYKRDKSVQNGGRLLTFGSDFPATGSVEGMYPLTNIEIGITRKPMNFKNAPTTPPTNKTLFLETMIKGYIINAAYQLKLEKEISSIEVEKKADIVILEKIYSIKNLIKFIITKLS